MIGNDVVDIIQSRKESNWQRRGFLNKLFTTEEQQLIKNYHEPEIMVWTLWSMKEAVYKIYNRQTGIRAYIPKQLVCTVDHVNLGTVIINNHTYHTKTTVQDNCIYTIATQQKLDLENIYELHNVIIIKDHNGFPYVANRHNDKKQPVSVSHHGRYFKVAAINSSHKIVEQVC